MLPLDEIRTLLNEHDDPVHRERPQNFDKEASARRFTLLTAALERRFGRSGGAGLYQDASVYGRFSVADGTGSAGELWVELSNFGGFVTAGTGTDWSADGAADLSAEFETWLDEVCTAAGCVFVPLQLLLEPYDGPTATLVDDDRYFLEVLAALGPDGPGGTEDEDEDEDDDEDLQAVWCHRYFDYV
ncbi:hypothetical protein G3I32_35490 [Streptomyces coelicoflavus]|uniref:Uncharacterized protein n=1 Tax=Streptomyces coelicoflavus TaxID=285562 RepID=A0A7K3PYL2_9ACTN|nr:hypothetical protein [Streptomyces coelicoflavus]NEB14075.1 hypothetical protein [Streptomyces coelicoflavus]